MKEKKQTTYKTGEEKISAKDITRNNRAFCWFNTNNLDIGIFHLEVPANPTDGAT
jgi:hypothetical protein